MSLWLLASVKHVFEALGNSTPPATGLDITHLAVFSSASVFRYFATVRREIGTPLRDSMTVRLSNEDFQSFWVFVKALIAVPRGSGPRQVRRWRFCCGEITRRILRKIAGNDFTALGDMSTLADPSVVDDRIENRMNLGHGYSPSNR